MTQRRLFRGILLRAVLVNLWAVFFILSANDVFLFVQQGPIENRSVALAADGPRLIVWPFVVEYKRKVQVLLAGSGFKPNQRVELRVPMEDLKTDISYSVEPEPIANAFGAFTSLWTLDDEIRRKLLKPIAYTVEVFDEEGRLLTTAPLIFCDSKAPDADKSPACAVTESKKK
jgi:hypothetical protein